MPLDTVPDHVVPQPLHVILENVKLARVACLLVRPVIGGHADMVQHLRSAAATALDRSGR